MESTLYKFPYQTLYEGGVMKGGPTAGDSKRTQEAERTMSGLQSTFQIRLNKRLPCKDWFVKSLQTLFAKRTKRGATVISRDQLMLPTRLTGN